MYSTGNEVVDQMQTFAISGNVIPQNWYRHIVRDNGKPDLLAISILADIVYWYRPTEVRDETTGQVTGLKKKFKGDKLQRSNADFADFFGESYRTIQRATAKLETMGLIKKSTADAVIKGVMCYNVMYIELVPEKLAEITYYDCKIEEKTEEESAADPMTNLTPPHDKFDMTPMTNLSPPHDRNVMTNTKIITETTTKIISSSFPTPLNKKARRKKEEEEEKLKLRFDFKSANQEYPGIAAMVLRVIQQLPYVEQVSLNAVNFMDICQVVVDNAAKIKMPEKYIVQVIHNLLAGKEIRKSKKPKSGNGFANKQNYDFEKLEEQLLS